MVRSLLLASVLMIGAVQAQALEVGDHAPCVVLKDVQVDGSTVEQCIRTRDAGKTYVMLEFFSATCSDCAANLPVLSQLAKEVLATTTTRLVGIDRSEDLMRNYVIGHRDLIDFPVALDLGRQATTAYGVDATPTIFILDADNKVVYKLVGTFDDNQLAIVKSLVAH